MILIIMLNRWWEFILDPHNKSDKWVIKYWDFIDGHADEEKLRVSDIRET